MQIIIIIKKNMNDVTFIIKDKFLLANKNLHPQPISNFTPKWFQNIKISKPKYKSNKNFIDNVFNVKSCPSFLEIYKEGFVIPAPHDYLLSYDSETKKWFWETPIKYKDFTIVKDGDQVTVHGNSQFLDYLPNNPYKKIFKLNLPYKIVTSKNISIRQMPVPFSYNNNWEALYGTFRSDKVHEVNIQIGYKTNNKDILIKQGEPLCVYLPYKRENYKLNIVNEKNKKAKIVYKNMSKLYSSFNKNFKNIEYYLN